MNTEELVEIFKRKPYLIKMGKGALSKRLKVPKEAIVAAKNYFILIKSFLQRKSLIF